MKKKIILIIVGAVLLVVTISGCIYLFYYKNISADTDSNLSSPDSDQELFGRILLSDVRNSLDNITITQNSSGEDLAKFKNELVKKVLEDAQKLSGDCSEIRGSIFVTITQEKFGVTDPYTLFVVMDAYLFKAKRVSGSCGWKRSGRIKISMLQFCFQELIGEKEFYCQEPEASPVIGKPNGQIIFRESLLIPASGQPPAIVCCRSTPSPTPPTPPPPSSTNTYSPAPTTPRP